jgi:hypothetical protein
LKREFNILSHEAPARVITETLFKLPWRQPTRGLLQSKKALLHEISSWGDRWHGGCGYARLHCQVCEDLVELVFTDEQVPSAVQINGTGVKCRLNGELHLETPWGVGLCHLGGGLVVGFRVALHKIALDLSHLAFPGVFDEGADEIGHGCAAQKRNEFEVAVRLLSYAQDFCGTLRSMLLF